MIVFFFISGLAQSQIKTIPYQALPTAAGTTVGSTMFFGASMSTSTITITFTGPSDRYIALGLGTFMNPTDALIYTVGKPGAFHALGWNDYYVSSGNINGVNNDVNQDWTILSNTVASGQRTVVASRALSTGDANDAIVSYTAASLGVVWARNATADYTIAYHGNTNRAFNIILPWLTQPAPAFTSTTTVCQGSSVTYSNTTTGGQSTYTWNFQGGNPATSTATNPVVTYSVPGTYSVSLIAANAVGSNTLVQTNYITVNPQLSPSISISTSNGSICAGATFTANATPINGGAAPIYQWKINGVNAGSNSPNFSSNALAANATITCVMISNATCASPSSVSSVAIPVVVSSTAAAAVSVAISAGSNPLCLGGSVGFSATAVNGGSAPIYQWQVNNVNSGSNSPTFSLIPGNGNVVRCLLTSNDACASVLSATSAVITLTVSSVLVPSLSISQTGGSNPACAGQTLSFTALPLNGGASPVFQWMVNGQASGSNTPIFSSSTLSNGSVISCSMVSSSQCANPSNANSNSITFTVYPVPAQPSISPSGTVFVCAGSTLVLNSSATSGNVWSNGATTNSVGVSSGGTYTVQSVINGCNSLPSAAVQVSVNPLPAVFIGQLTALCVDDAPAILTASPTGGSFGGTGVSGTQFSPATAGVGTKSVSYLFTDTKGCSNTAVTTVSVSDCVGLGTQAIEGSQLSIFPNPSNGIYLLHYNGKEPVAIMVKDMKGQVVLETHAESGQLLQLDLSAFPAGIYVIESATHDQRSYYKVLKL